MSVRERDISSVREVHAVLHLTYNQFSQWSAILGAKSAAEQSELSSSSCSVVSIDGSCWFA